VERIVERLGEAGMADSSKRIVFTGHSMVRRVCLALICASPDANTMATT
jgi:hypothetical protein